MQYNENICTCISASHTFLTEGSFWPQKIKTEHRPKMTYGKIAGPGPS